MNCPKCNAALSVPEKYYGTNIRCPTCRTAFLAQEPTSTSEDAPEIIAVAPPKPMRRRKRSASRSSRQLLPSSQWWDLFDWKFKKYVTPLIIRTTWVVCVAFAALWLLLILFSFANLQLETADPQAAGFQFDPDAAKGLVPSSLSAFLTFCLSRLMLIVFVVLVLLWVRVILESVIVLFNIAGTLASIDDKTVGVE